MNDKKFIKLTPFKMQVLQSFPFIDADFDALTNYELLCKVVEYLNITVDNVDLLNEKVEEFENYFNDLDVQEEINNKLDEMAEDGTLASIINEDLLATINQNVTNNTNAILELQNKQNETDSDIDNINNINLEQSAHIGALEQDQTLNVKKHEVDSITLDMLTQEVRSAMTGGSTPIVGTNSIGTKELIDGGVTVYKLDEKLKSLYTLNYTQVEKPVNKFQGFYQQNSSNQLVYINSSQDLQCYQIPLENGKSYRFSGYNYSAVKGIYIATALDTVPIAYSESGTSLRHDDVTVISNAFSTDFIFECTEDNLIAFITEFVIGRSVNNPTLQNIAGGLFELTSIELFSNELPRNVLETLEPYNTIDGYETQIPGNPYGLRALSGYTIKCYQFKKGHKYKVNGNQQYLVAGFLLFDNQFYNIYASATQNNPSKVNYEYEFTSLGDYYGCTIEGGGTSSIVKEYVIGSDDDTVNRLIGKKIIYNGDSITQSRTNESNVNYNGGAYPKIISDITGSTYVNYAVGGGTLASASGGYRIVNEVVNMDSDADVIVFSGGINDYWQNIPLGSYTPNDYTGSVDITTVSGALEKIFRDSINKWVGKPILFVITHKIYNTAYTQNSAGYTFEELHDRIVAICDKYSIPYYDCYKDGGLNSYMSIMNTTFMTAGNSGQPDYTHPNESAYKKYYVPQVLELINKNLPY